MASKGRDLHRTQWSGTRSPREALGGTGYGMARDRLVEIRAICTRVQVCGLLLARAVGTGPCETCTCVTVNSTKLQA